jgi:hypothetical protein
MAAPLYRRILRGLEWAVFGRPALQRVGPLTRPRRLYVEATVTSPDVFTAAYGEPVAWARLDLVEHDYGLGGRIGFELGQLRRGSEHREVAYTVLGAIVRGGELTVETAHGEVLTLRDGTFTSTPHQLRATPLRALPRELGGNWPGTEPDLPMVKQACLRRGDVVRFEALFTPERHPRRGSSYRDEVDVRLRVDRGKRLIQLVLVVPDR